MTIRFLLLSAIVSISAVLLEGCGVPVCVAGLGNCSSVNQAAQNTGTTSSTGQLAVSANPVRVVIGQTSQFSASGGTCPCTYSIATGYNNPTSAGTIDSSSGLYNSTGVTVPTGQTQVVITIQVTDVNNLTGIGTVAVGTS